MKRLKHTILAQDHTIRSDNDALVGIGRMTCFVQNCDAGGPSIKLTGCNTPLKIGFRASAIATALHSWTPRATNRKPNQNRCHYKGPPSLFRHAICRRGTFVDCNICSSRSACSATTWRKRLHKQGLSSVPSTNIRRNLALPDVSFVDQGLRIHLLYATWLLLSAIRTRRLHGPKSQRMRAAAWRSRAGHAQSRINATSSNCVSNELETANSTSSV